MIEREPQQDALSQMIEKLKTGSNFDHNPLSDGRIELVPKAESLEGENNMVMESVETKENPNLRKGYDFFKERFDHEEVGNFKDIWESAVDWNDDSQWPEESRRRDIGEFMMHVIQRDEKVEAASTATYIPFRDEAGEGTDQAVLQVCYLESEQLDKRKELGTELYIQCMEKAKQIAEEREHKLSMIAMETGGERQEEELLNGLGGARVYFKNTEGKMEEIKYIQPPLEWDTDTAKVLEGAGASPNHLMVSLTSGEKKISKQQLIEAIRGIYQYNNLWHEDDWGPEDGDDDECEAVYKKAEKYVMGYLKRLAKQIGEADELVLLTAEEREEMQSEESIEFIEHTKAD